MPPRLPESSVRRFTDKEAGAGWGSSEDHAEDAGSAVDGLHKAETSTVSTAGTPTHGDDLCGLEGGPFNIPGLQQVMRTAHLSESIREAAMTWCDSQGVVTIEEVVDVYDDFADALSLRPMEKRRLENVLSDAVGSDGKPLAQRVAFRVRGSKTLPTVPLRELASAGKSKSVNMQQPIPGEGSLEDFLPTIGIREVSRVVVALGAAGIETKADLMKLDKSLWTELDEQLRLEKVTIGDRAKMKKAKKTGFSKFISWFRPSRRRKSKRAAAPVAKAS